ncbi:MAG: DUF167 domain-containing protein [Gallionella sp.]|nr:DUF167 domain-containing protein [Gallionella sp.]
MLLAKKPAEARPCYRWEDDTLVLNILGRPNSKKNAIGRVIGHQLEVHVAAIPRMGGATAHMVRFLAEIFDVSKSAIVVVFGEKNVNKQVRIKSPSHLPPPIQRVTAPVKTDKKPDKQNKTAKKKPR